MNTTLIAVLIGAGNIGSRHAQALMRVKKDIHLTVFDISINALDTCKTRIEEIDRNNYLTKVNYITTFDALPKNALLAIIATNSENRLSSLENLIANCHSECIILEKFLFSTEEEYKKAGILIQQNKNSQVYVNCVKRQFKAYLFVKEKLDAIEGNGKIKLELTGNNWGLAGNAVHYLDLFCFLTNSSFSTIDIPVVSFSEIIESKRIGYIELLGVCNAATKEGHTISITSAPGNYDKIECVIEKDNCRFKVIEYPNSIEVLTGNEKTVFEYPFQSSLTHLYAEQFLAAGKTTLVKYSSSADYHLKFLKAVSQFIEKKNYKKTWKIT